MGRIGSDREPKGRDKALLFETETKTETKAETKAETFC